MLTDDKNNHRTHDYIAIEASLKSGPQNQFRSSNKGIIGFTFEAFNPNFLAGDVGVGALGARQKIDDSS
jgi:hypothetical protein